MRHSNNLCCTNIEMNNKDAFDILTSKELLRKASTDYLELSK